MSDALKLIFQAVSSKKKNDIVFWIPEIWLNQSKADVLERKGGLVRVEPYSFFKARLSEIMPYYADSPKNCTSLSNLKRGNGKGSAQGESGQWLDYANIYGLFIRSFSAFDHNQDGALGGGSDLTVNSQGIRETGTFLKSIALLPYIKSLGFTAIYLEPFAAIGSHRKRGELGSPQAVKNPFQINPELHDTLLDEFNVNIEAKAFFEAAHSLSLRVLVDIPSRMAALDSDWIQEHPDWFYWITKDNPLKGQDHPLGKDIHFEHGYTASIQNRKVFVPDGSFFSGENEETLIYRDRTFLKIFLDTPGDKISWQDIPSLKTGHENKPLWDSLIELVRYYQEEFGIDGLWTSAHYELPARLENKILENAREIDPDFALLSQEEQSWKKLSKLGIQSFGHYLWDLSRPELMSVLDKGKLKSLLLELSSAESPILGAPESRSTPRASMRMGGAKFSMASWVLICTLPSLIPFCHSGFELGDRHPADLGPDYRPEEFRAFLGRPLSGNDRLSLEWESPDAPDMADLIKKMNSFRSDNLALITRKNNIRFLNTEVDGKASFSPGNPVICYIRIFEEEILSMLPTGIFGEVIYPVEIENDYLVVVNMDFENERIATIKLDEEMRFHNIFRREEYKTVSGEINFQLKPGDTIIAVSI